MLNAWSPTGDALFGDSGKFRRWSLTVKNPLGVGPWWYAAPNFFLSGPLLSVHHEEKIPFIHTPTEVTFYPGTWGQVTVTQTL